MTDMGSLGGSGYATSINSLGQAAGESFTAAGRVHAFLYSGGAINDLGTLGGSYSHASGINGLGQVVGQASTAGGAYHAFLYTDGVMRDLNTLAPNSGWTLSVAMGINDNGQIIGSGTNPFGRSDAFLLTPVPEPTALAFLGMGAAGLFCWRRRRSGRACS